MMPMMNGQMGMMPGMGMMMPMMMQRHDADDVQDVLRDDEGRHDDEDDADRPRDDVAHEGAL